MNIELRHDEIYQSYPNVSARFMWPVERGSGPDAVRQALAANSVVSAEQVHGTSVAIVDEASPNVMTDVDGLVTNCSKIVLGIAGADCQVLLAVDPDANVIGATHAGWKGVLEGIGPEMIRQMEHLGATRTQIRITIGPSIGPCHYQVDQKGSEPRFQKLLDRFGSDVAYQVNGQKILDLRAAERQQLLKHGMLPHNLFIDQRCTFCAAGNFPSHRKEGERRTHNLIGAIMQH